ncbi:hypothetical protein B0A54_12806 [Friedmanniomyces endolithicus]|uniref:GED domain-containing protein n=1 Tax=Friedmanniomyces endolithicus TaxID=329885 RepID=A0A4U0UML9_9PEZI|nr:hypothetical protein B0A54_12806 [Friedmanniomyces endolithicus]
MGSMGTDSLPVSGDDGGPSSVHYVAAPKTIGSSSLDALQSTDSRRVMDIVDKLRRSGLSGILQLPQLVVSGDQSSGKSSVLEAITEIPFPRKENLCTRFATEIILRRATTTSINVKIIPDKQRPSMEKKRLEQYKSTIVDFTELPALMEEATNLMGLNDDGSGAIRAFSRDVLSIEIAGPGRPQLTLVDLPGLIHTDNKKQSKEDVALIQGLVDEYIKEKRTIIMAVVSAKNDYANQIILKRCRDIDPKGNRTIGIITKPDYLDAGSENEANWIELAENKDIFLELGWHFLKNRSDKEVSKSFTERNANEAAFFATGRYRDLPPEMVGIESLRNRLSQMLYKHLKAELSSLQKELNEQHSEVVIDLEKLGEKRTTTREQRRFLMKLSQEYQDVVKAAVNGQYEHNFFGTLDPDTSIDDEGNMRRIRAAVQYLNMQFASAMREFGHKRIPDGSDEVVPLSECGADKNAVEPALDEDYAHFSVLQVAEARDDAIERVRRILIRSRGRELPGTFNPLIISQLFWEQSHNWQSIAEFHIKKVAQVCSSFVAAAISCIVADDVATRLQASTVNPALQSRVERAKAELCRVIADNKHHPITYDPTYIAKVQDMRRKKSDFKFKGIVDQARTSIYSDTTRHFEHYLKPDVLDRGKGDLLEHDMDKTSAEDALDSQQAYYKEEVKYFISAVTKQVIERHLMRDLTADTLSPMLVGDMTDDDVAFIAAEPEETVRLRSNLETRKTMLEKGQETFKSALGLCK